MITRVGEIVFQIRAPSAEAAVAASWQHLGPLINVKAVATHVLRSWPMQRRAWLSFGFCRGPSLPALFYLVTQAGMKLASSAFQMNRGHKETLAYCVSFLTHTPAMEGLVLKTVLSHLLCHCFCSNLEENLNLTVCSALFRTYPSGFRSLDYICSWAASPAPN